MNESLAQLLLRLNEAGEPAILWGRQAKPYAGRAFDRLLVAGVLIEQAPATEWPVCADCECGLEVRLIEKIGDRVIASCPIDARSDDVLDKQDLRSFRIDQKRLVTEVAIASGFPMEPDEVLPGVWMLGTMSVGRVAFVAFGAASVESPGLFAALRAEARGAPVTLLAPALPFAVRKRFEEAGIHIAVLWDAIGNDGRASFALDLSRLVPRAGGGPRLVIAESIRRVTLDGIERSLAVQPFRLLCLLAERARAGGATVERRKIEAHIWGTAIGTREARDVVRELRDGLAKGSAGPEPIRALIESRRNPNGYRLALAPEDIELQP